MTFEKLLRSSLIRFVWSIVAEAERVKRKKGVPAGFGACARVE
jgi:hypothetical protein